MKERDFKITFERKFEKYTVKFDNVDVSLEQIYKAINGILIGLTYSQDIIDQYFIERTQEISEEEKL